MLLISSICISVIITLPTASSFVVNPTYYYYANNKKNNNNQQRIKLIPPFNHNNNNNIHHHIHHQRRKERPYLLPRLKETKRTNNDDDIVSVNGETFSGNNNDNNNISGEAESSQVTDEEGKIDDGVEKKNEQEDNNIDILSNFTVLESEEIIGVLTENEMSKLNNVRYRARIVMDRAYARSDSFSQQNLYERPTLEDLLPTPFPIWESFYATIPGQLLMLVGSSLLFPYIVRTIEPLIDMKPQELNDIVSDFVPGVSILYGTMITLTLSNLYTRQTSIQDAISKETALLSIVTKNLLSLFANDEDLLVNAAKCVADQVTILVMKSRGEELMNMIFNDPYERIVDLIDAEEERIENRQGNFLRKGQLLANCRDLINQLAEVRAKRISQEANALSETHFTILNSLTILILFGYTISVLPTIEVMGNVVSQDTSFLFGCLTCVYSTFYFFAYDLNEPFSGAYQLRRSASATSLLQIKWNLVNHKRLKDKIQFDE